MLPASAHAVLWRREAVFTSAPGGGGIAVMIRVSILPALVAARGSSLGRGGGARPVARLQSAVDGRDQADGRAAPRPRSDGRHPDCGARYAESLKACRT